MKTETVKSTTRTRQSSTVKTGCDGDKLNNFRQRKNKRERKWI